MTSRPGDWIQVQCPTAFILTAYDISGVYNLCQNSPIGQNRTAPSFYIVGSNDGTTWYPVDYKSGMVYPNATILHLYPTTTITTAFSYYRIIADHLAGEPYPIWNIANLNFYHNTTIYPPIQLTSAGVSGVSTTNKTVSGQAYGNGTYTFSTNITSYAVSNLTTNILGNVTVDTVGVYPFLDLTGHYNGDGSYNGSESTFVSNNPSPSNVVCFKEGSKILTDTGYKPIQDLRKGDLVQTFVHGYKAIDMIGKRDMIHIGSDQRIKDQLYVCTPTNYPELLEDLVITGCHSILVDDFKEGEEQRTREINGDTYITDNMWRLPACADLRAAVYDKKGVHTIYHIALENDDYYMNYGVYANGLLVETCSKRYLKELSNMEELF